MKKQLFLGFLAFFVSGSYAQTFYVGTDGMHIGSGDEVTVKDWNFEAAGDIVGDGTLGIRSTTTAQTLDVNNNSVNNLLVDNTSDVSLISAATIGNDLEFVAGNVDIAGNDLTITDGGTFTNASASNKVITPSTGNLVQTVGTSAVVFPIAFATGDYNPATITAAAAGNAVSVRATDDVLADGNTGTVYSTDVVDVRWNINNAGTDNLDITLSWAASQETTDFDRTNAGIGRSEGSGNWDLTSAMLGAAAGSDPYSITRTGVDVNGVFAIGDAESDLIGAILLQARVLLGGPYASAGIMNDDLRAAGVIPTTEPYTGLTGFTHTGNGGGEVALASIFADNGDNTNIVDWVFVELRDETTPATVLQSRAALLRKDGLVVDVDGTSPVTFEGLDADNYYFSINHRNHLAVMTGAAVALSSTATEYDLTDASSPNYVADYTTGGGAVAQYTSTDSKKYMIPGDVNADGVVISNGSPSDKTLIDSDILADSDNPFPGASGLGVPAVLTYAINNAYSVFDINCDASVISNGSPSDATLVDNNVLAHPNNPFSGASGLGVPAVLTYSIIQQLP